MSPKVGFSFMFKASRSFAAVLGVVVLLGVAGAPQSARASGGVSGDFAKGIATSAMAVITVPTLVIALGSAITFDRSAGPGFSIAGFAASVVALGSGIYVLANSGPSIDGNEGIFIYPTLTVGGITAVVSAANFFWGSHGMTSPVIATVVPTADGGLAPVFGLRLAF